MRLQLLFAAVAAAQVPDVHTSSGILQGTAPLPNVHAYLGIPYAQPPVGELRFAPPVPFNSSAARPCFESSPGCYQTTFVTVFADRSTGTGESEDMLSINVWAPANAHNLPVLIFIHGGAFTSGANALPEYDATGLVGEQGNFIVASINYRVNVFGFPNSPALAQKNLGLLDQRLAIEWLRTNIGGFGGDATRMTLSGHSAGAQSTAYYAYAYAHDPIVRALITFSGQPGTVPTDTGASWRNLTASFSCNGTDPAAELACLRAQPARALKRALSITNTPTIAQAGNQGGAPIVDNVTVLAPSGYAARNAAGAFAPLPLLAAHTTHEGDIDLPADPVAGINQTLSDEITLAQFQCPTAATAGAWARRNATVYRYLYNGTFASQLPYSWLRPFHGSDLELVFTQERRTQYQDLSTATVQAARYLRDAVGAFVRDPVHGLAARGWPTYNPNATTIVRLFGNETADVGRVDPRVYDQPCAALAAAMGSGGS